MEEYLEELKGQIRDKYAKDFVSAEMRGHIEDQMEAYEESGMTYEEAVHKAVAEMGDPVSVGADLDRIHRPHLEWRFLLYVLFISALNILVQYVINSNMPVKTGAGIFENLSRASIFVTVVGITAMLIVYRLDYTILAGRSRIIGAAYMIVLTVLSVFCSESINGMAAWIKVGAFRVSVFGMMVFFLPVFAGILYEYRGKGRSAVAKIALWMLVPVFVQVHAGYITSPAALFILTAEVVLFVITLRKNWYAVNMKAVISCGVGLFIMLISGALIRIYSFNGYQADRLNNWLAHYGIGSYAEDANSAVNYVNGKLGDAFANSNLFGRSDVAIAVMREIPSYRSNFLLASVSANLGIACMVGIIICLALLSIYVFVISLRQKNSLGCIVGCSCGIAISLQSLSNILIVFSFLPLTDSVLPFFASGLSLALVDYILLGLVLSIYRYKDIRREKPVARLTLRRAE